jgi:hypothetical protein
MSNYEPSQTVVNTHNLPHINIFDKSVDNSDFSIDEDYFISVAGLPFIILCAGIFSILIFQGFFCFRCCGYGNPYSPSEEVDYLKLPGTSHSKWISHIINRRGIAIKLFFFFLLCLLLADHLIYIGNGRINDGVYTASDGLVLLFNMFTNIFTDSSSMIDSSNVINSEINGLQISSPACYAIVGDIPASLSLLTDSLYLLTNLTSTLPGTLDNANTDLLEYGIDKKNMIVFYFYAFIVGVAFIYLVGYCCSSKILLKFSITFTEILCLLLSIMCCIEMCIGIVYADFCMSPSANVVDSLGEGSSADIVSYVSECVGVNPFVNATDSSFIALEALQSSITTLVDDVATSCYQNSDLEETLPQVSLLINSLYSITNTTNECPPIQLVWETIVNQSFCTKLFSGFFVIYACQFLMSLFLFLTMSSSAMMYPFMEKRFWKLTKEDINGAFDPVANLDSHDFEASAPPMQNVEMASKRRGQNKSINLNAL